MIDFHCHLDLYPDPWHIIAGIQEQQIRVLAVTTTPSAWSQSSQLAPANGTIRTALGLHPQIAAERKAELKLFDRYLGDTRYVGEVGLDGSPDFRSSWEDQLAVFDHILNACSEAQGKILSIHSRRAVKPVLDLLDKHLDIPSPILHWFSGSRAELRRAIQRGCWFSVGPAMLISARGRDLVTAMPHDRVVLETDGPFASFQRVPLNPWDIRLASQSLALVWDQDEPSVERIIAENERSLLTTLR